MITEDYVSFDTAKLLKEKGFDESCYREYHETDNGYEFGFSAGQTNSMWDDEFEHFGVQNYAAPTIQMAMKWLRKKHDLHIEITSIKPYGSNGNGHEIPLDGVEYHSNIVQNNKWIDIIKKFKSHGIDCYCSYEEASDAAIKHCLEKLI